MRTGDLVERGECGGLRFIGRASDAFKLANGRFVGAARHEAAIRRALPEVEEAMLRPDGDESLELLLTVADTASAPSTSRAALALHGDPRARATVVPREAWRRTQKGDVDRRRPLAG